MSSAADNIKSKLFPGAYDEPIGTRSSFSSGQQQYSTSTHRDRDHFVDPGDRIQRFNYAPNNSDVVDSDDSPHNGSGNQRAISPRSQREYFEGNKRQLSPYRASPGNNVTGTGGTDGSYLSMEHQSHTPHHPQRYPRPHHLNHRNNSQTPQRGLSGAPVVGRAGGPGRSGSEMMIENSSGNNGQMVPRVGPDPTRLQDSRLQDISTEVMTVQGFHKAMRELEVMKNHEITALQAENVQLRRRMAGLEEAVQVAVKALDAEAATASYLSTTAKKRDLQSLFWHWRCRLLKNQNKRLGSAVSTVYTNLINSMKLSSVVQESRNSAVLRAIKDLSVAESELVDKRARYFGAVEEIASQTSNTMASPPSRYSAPRSTGDDDESRLNESPIRASSDVAPETTPLSGMGNKANPDKDHRERHLRIMLQHYQRLSAAYTVDVDNVLQKRMSLVHAYLNAAFDQYGIAAQLQHRVKPFEALALKMFPELKQERAKAVTAEALRELQERRSVTSSAPSVSASSRRDSAINTDITDGFGALRSASSPNMLSPSLMQHAALCDLTRDAHIASITATAVPPLISLMKVALEDVTANEPAYQRGGTKEDAVQVALPAAVTQISQQYFDCVERVLLKSPMTAASNVILRRWMDNHFRMPDDGSLPEEDKRHEVIADGDFNKEVRLPDVRLFIQPVMRSVTTLSDAIARARQEEEERRRDAELGITSTSLGMGGVTSNATTMTTTAKPSAPDPYSPETYQNSQLMMNTSPAKLHHPHQQQSQQQASGYITPQLSQPRQQHQQQQQQQSPQQQQQTNSRFSRSADTTALQQKPGTSYVWVDKEDITVDNRSNSTAVGTTQESFSRSGRGNDGYQESILKERCNSPALRGGAHEELDDAAMQLADAMVRPASDRPLVHRWEGVSGFNTAPLRHLMHLASRTSPVRPTPMERSIAESHLKPPPYGSAHYEEESSRPYGSRYGGGESATTMAPARRDTPDEIIPAVRDRPSTTSRRPPTPDQMASSATPNNKFHKSDSNSEILRSATPRSNAQTPHLNSVPPAPPPPPPPQQQQPQPHTGSGSPRSPSENQRYLQRISRLYAVYAPDRSATEVLSHYAGQEEKLMAALIAKYGPEPSEEEATAALQSYHDPHAPPALNRGGSNDRVGGPAGGLDTKAPSPETS